MPEGAEQPVPVLLVTDIGRDIDDTVALACLSTYEAEGAVKLVGLVATGGVGESRARLARFWLRKLGFPDERVPVAACPAPGNDISNACVFPDLGGDRDGQDIVPPLDQAAIYEGKSRESAAADLVLEVANRYAGGLVVLAIGPLTPIHAALSLPGGKHALQSSIARLCIQAQATIGQDGELIPDFAAFNLREDKEASIGVFKDLQSSVPFELLGKHAAYRVAMERGDFERWDADAGVRIMEPLLEGLLSSFRRNNPESFYSIYPIPEALRDTVQWFQTLTHVSHPYDPLLLIAACRPRLFTRHMVKNGSCKDSHALIGVANDGDCGISDTFAVLSELKRVFWGAAEIYNSQRSLERRSDCLC